MLQSWNVFRAMFVANFKECVRDILPFLFSFALPLFFIISFGMQASKNETQSAIFQVAVSGEGQQVDLIKDDLDKNAIFHTDVLDEKSKASDEALIESGKYQVVIQVTDEGLINVITSNEALGVATLIKNILTSSPKISEDNAVMLSPLPEQKISGISNFFGAILTLALLQVALFGTASPVIGAKEKGLYKLYKIIPMPKLGFLCSHVAVRYIISIIQLILLCVIGIFLFNIKIANPVIFIITLLLSALVLVCYGYAIAGLFSRLGVASGFLLLLNFYCFAFGLLFYNVSDSLWQLLVYTTPVGFVSEGLRLSVTGYSYMFSASTVAIGLIFYLLLSIFVGLRFFSFSPKKS